MKTLPEFVGSLDGGLIGGAIGGAVIAIGFYLQNPASGLYRIPLVIVYSMIAAGAEGAAAEFGVPFLRQLSLRNRFIPRSGWLLAVVLCGLAGIPVGVLGGAFFAHLGGPLDPYLVVLDPRLVVFGCLIGTVGVVLIPILRAYGNRSGTTLRAIGFAIAVSATHCLLGGAVVFPLRTAIANMFAGTSASMLSGGSLIGGGLGALMGSQMWLTLFLFGRWKLAGGLQVSMPDSTRASQSDDDAKGQSSYAYDVFICHATEDKASYVDRLASALKAAGIKAWYNQIDWGDNVRGSIDNGLRSCRFGIVVFSKAFLTKKRWTEYELDGLHAKESLEKKVILPIWHGVTRYDFLQYGPVSFADRLAKDSQQDSIEEIVFALKQKLASAVRT